MRSPLTRLVAVVAWALAFFLAGRAWAIEVDSLVGEVAIAGPWLTRFGDDPAGADPDLDASAWERIDDISKAVPSSWEPGVRWLRTEVTLVGRARADAKDPIGLAVGRIRGGYELYVNGRLVGQRGSVVPGEYLVALPTTYAMGNPERGERWVIALRVYAAPLVISDAHQLVPVVPRIGPAALMLLGTRLDYERLLAGRVVPFFVFAALWIAVAANHVALYRRRRELRGHLFFAGVCMASTLWAAMVAARGLPLFNDAILVRVQVAAYQIGAALLVEFTRSFVMGTRTSVILRAFQVWALVLASATLLLPAAVVPLMWGAAPQISLNIGVLLSVGEMARAVRQGQREARFMLVGAASMGVAMLIAFLADYLHIRSAWSFLIPMVGMAGFIASMSIALLDHYTIALRTLEASYEATRRFVPAEFLEMLGKRTIQEVEKGDHVKREMSVMFSDIRSFTTLSEKMTPEETFRFINEYLAFMEGPIGEKGGVIDKYLGDGIMAMFPGRAEDAIDGGIAMLRAVDAFNAERALAGGAPITIGIGIHTGMLMAGTIGGKNRLSCTVLSDAVNLAARVEGMTKLYGATLLITGVTYARLADKERFEVRVVDRVVAKGKTEPVMLYEVIDGEPPARRAEKIAGREEFAAALAVYVGSSFEDARARFAAYSRVYPTDAAARLYVERCDELLKRGAPTGWDGITRLEAK